MPQYTPYTFPRRPAASALLSMPHRSFVADFSAHALFAALCLAFFALFLLPAAASALPVRSAILMNASTGQILYEKNATAAIPPASLTKIMNMFLALDAVAQGKTSLNTRITITPAMDRTGGSSMHLRKGEKVTLRTLLTGMAVASGNDAARAAARLVSGSERRHVNRMNARARELGMRRTTFKNVTGLPASGQLTCVRDMLTMTCAYLRRHPQAATFHSTRRMTHNGRDFYNTNKLLGTVDGVNGLKTGYTGASGYNLIFTAQRGKVRLIGVVMGGHTSAARDSAARTLLEAGFRHPKDKKALARGLASPKQPTRKPKRKRR